MPENICIQCNKAFVVDRNHRTSKYCSLDCKKLYKDKQKATFLKERLLKGSKVCSKCKKELPLDNFTGTTHMYCKNCSALWARERKASPKRNWKHEQELAFKRKGKDYKSYLTTNLPAIRSRAKKKEIPFDITCQDLIELAENQNFLCALTEEPMTFTVGIGTVQTNCSVDRIVPSLGYIKENIQLVTLRANTIKNTATLNELYTVCKNILKVAEKKSTKTSQNAPILCKESEI